jgi:hypothetical protein
MGDPRGDGEERGSSQIRFPFYGAPYELCPGMKSQSLRDPRNSRIFFLSFVSNLRYTIVTFGSPCQKEDRRMCRMGNETRWRSPSVPSEGPPFQKGGLYLEPCGIYIEEVVGGRPILCDYHCGPMYHFPVFLARKGDFVMCWVSDCGRCYNESLGYFHLRTTRPTLGRSNEDKRSMAVCPNETCPTRSSMAITRSDDPSSGDDKTCWFCFDCGAEFPRRNVHGPCERLLRSFRPSSYQRLSAKH